MRGDFSNNYHLLSFEEQSWDRSDCINNYHLFKF